MPALPPKPWIPLLDSEAAHMPEIVPESATETALKTPSKPSSSLILQRLSRRVPPKDFLPHFCEVARVQARRAYSKRYLANRVEPGSGLPSPANMGEADCSMMSLGDISFASNSVLNESSISATSDGKDATEITPAARLAQRLDDCALRMETVGDDGNCLFRAAAHQLHGNQEDHTRVRERAVASLRDRADELQEFFGSKQDFEEYLNHMAMDRTWGDELVLCAVAESYHCIVHVVTSHKTNWYLVYTPTTVAADDEGAPEEIFVAYIAPVHYNSVVLRKAVVEE